MKRVIRLVVGVMVPLLAAGPVSVAAQALSPQEIFRQVSPSVVLIEVWGEYSETNGSEIIASGSGVVIPSDRGDNVIVTNCHLTDKSGGSFFRVSGMGDIGGLGMNYERDAERDLCTIRALMLDRKRTRKNEEPNHIKLPPVQIASSRGLEVGDTVYAVGAPQGLEATLSNGIVSGFREHEGVEYIQTTAPISQGSSGGGLFNSRGQLVGITTMFIKEGQALNFAVPAELIPSADVKGVVSQVVASDGGNSGYASKRELVDDRWQTFYADDKKALDIDTQTIKRVYDKANPRANQTVFWVRTRLSSPRNDGDGKNYIEDIRQYNFWCNDSGYIINHVIQRDAGGEVVFSHKYSVSELRVQDVVPGTIGEAIRDRGCSP